MARATSWAKAATMSSSPPSRFSARIGVVDLEDGIGGWDRRMGQDRRMRHTVHWLLYQMKDGILYGDADI